MNSFRSPPCSEDPDCRLTCWRMMWGLQGRVRDIHIQADCIQGTLSSMILPGRQTSDSASSLKFHHLALLALLVALSHSSNFHLPVVLSYSKILVFRCLHLRNTSWVRSGGHDTRLSLTSWRVDQAAENSSSTWSTSAMMLESCK